jgi:hypothetical protein
MFSEDRMVKITEYIIDALSDTPILDSEFSEKGWCLPLEKGMVDLYHHTISSKLSKIESIELFYAKNFETLIEPELVRESLLLIQPHSTMLQECIASYKHSHYSICIPALFSIIESMLVFLSNNGDFNKLKYSSALNLRITSGEFKNEKLVGKLEEIRSVISVLFSKVSFDSTEKDLNINRHASAHGRVERLYSQADALKLFALISLIKSCYEN